MFWCIAESGVNQHPHLEHSLCALFLQSTESFSNMDKLSRKASAHISPLRPQVPPLSKDSAVTPEKIDPMARMKRVLGGRSPAASPSETSTVSVPSASGLKSERKFVPQDVDSRIARRFSVFCDEAGQNDIRRDDALIEIIPLLVRAGVTSPVSEDKISEALDKACGEDSTRVDLSGFTSAFHILEKELAPAPLPLPAEWPARFNEAAAPAATISTRVAAKVICKLFKDCKASERGAKTGPSISFTTSLTNMVEKDVRDLVESHATPDGSIGLDSFVNAARQIFFGSTVTSLVKE